MLGFGTVGQLALGEVPVYLRYNPPPDNTRMQPIRDWWDYDAGGRIVPGFCIRNT